MIVITLLSPNLVRSEPCDEVIRACDEAIEGQQKVIEYQEEHIKMLKTMGYSDKKEVERLKAENDVWYKQSPWILPVLGFLAGGLTFSVLNK